MGDIENHDALVRIAKEMIQVKDDKGSFALLQDILNLAKKEESITFWIDNFFRCLNFFVYRLFKLILINFILGIVKAVVASKVAVVSISIALTFYCITKYGGSEVTIDRLLRILEVYTESISNSVIE